MRFFEHRDPGLSSDLDATVDVRHLPGDVPYAVAMRSLKCHERRRRGAGANQHETGGASAQDIGAVFGVTGFRTVLGFQAHSEG